jgi:hypothetical protein
MILNVILNTIFLGDAFSRFYIERNFLKKNVAEKGNNKKTPKNLFIQRHNKNTNILS